MEEVGGGSGAVVPGFRFYPTEEELISFYLHHKLHGTGGPDVDRVIPVVDIYRHEPWELPMVAAEEKKSEEQWFFFTAQQEREARGGKPNRTTATGYWKATGSPGWVYSTTTSSSNVIGMKKTMVFYKGRAPFGTKTPWKMNEYKATLHNISDASSSSSNIDPPPPIPKLRHEMSVCRVYITSAGSSRAFDRRPLFLDTVTPPLPPPSHHHPQEQPPPPPPLQQLQSGQGNSSDAIADYSINDDEDYELMISNGSQPFWEWERFNCP